MIGVTLNDPEVNGEIPIETSVNETEESLSVSRQTFNVDPCGLCGGFEIVE